MVNSVNNSTTSAATTSTATPTASQYMKQTTGLDKDDFLTLFVTQLQNQDPLNPTDTSGMVTQLAQISEVEQAYDTNTNLQSLLTAVNGQSSMSAVSFIGKTISAQGSQVNLTSGSQPTLSFSLPSAASQVQIAIQNSSGTTIRTLSTGATAAGDGSLVWDGKDSNNSPAPAGTYTFSVTGTGSDGSTFTGTPLINGVVDGVDLNQGSTVLTIGGIDVPLANVTTVSGQ